MAEATAQQKSGASADGQWAVLELAIQQHDAEAISLRLNQIEAVQRARQR